MLIYLDTQSPLTLAPNVHDKLDQACIRITRVRKQAGVIIRFAKSLPLKPIEHDDDQEVITFWEGGSLNSDDIANNNIFMNWNAIIEHIHISSELSDTPPPSDDEEME
jgi:hypothetical protein